MKAITWSLKIDHDVGDDDDDDMLYIFMEIKVWLTHVTMVTWVAR